MRWKIDWKLWHSHLPGVLSVGWLRAWVTLNGNGALVGGRISSLTEGTGPESGGGIDADTAGRGDASRDIVLRMDSGMFGRVGDGC